MNKYLQTALSTAVIMVTIFIGLFVYGKFGPGLPLSVNQSSANQAGPFSVSGEGKVSVKPDVAEVSMGVSATGATVAVVQTQANTAINKVTAELKKLGIEDADIETTNYNIYPQYSDGAVAMTTAAAPAMMAEPVMIDGNDRMLAPSAPVPTKSSTTPRITGYSMNVNIIVTVKDLAKVNQVIDAGTAAGANQIGGINFTVDDEETPMAEARKKAIADAKKKAQVLAAETGIQLVRIVTVYENPLYYPRNSIMSAKAEGMGGDMGQTKIEPGSTEIATQVTLVYETR